MKNEEIVIANESLWCRLRDCFRENTAITAPDYEIAVLIERLARENQ